MRLTTRFAVMGHILTTKKYLRRCLCLVTLDSEGELLSQRFGDFFFFSGSRHGFKTITYILLKGLTYHHLPPLGDIR